MGENLLEHVPENSHFAAEEDSGKRGKRLNGPGPGGSKTNKGNAAHI